ncbi:MAG: hypothetical protein ABIA11_04095 [Patescibacteria group bacterium]
MKKRVLLFGLLLVALLMFTTTVFAEGEPPEDPGCFGEVMSEKAHQKNFTVVGQFYKNWGQRMKDIAQGQNIAQPERDQVPGAVDWVVDVKLDICGIVGKCE